MRPHFSTRALIPVAFIFLLSSCGTLDKSLTSSGFPKGGSIIPDVPLRLTPNYTTSLASVAQTGLAAGILNYVYRPLDATWDVADVPLSHDTHRFSLRMKRFVTGGEGEIWPTAKRYAEQLQAAKGATGFVFIEFTTGIDSATPFARRVAEGTVKFNEVPPDPVMPPLAAAVPVSPKD